MQTVKPVASSWDDTLTHGYLPTAKISARLSGNPIQRKYISVIHRLIYTNISVWNSILACHGPVDGSVWEFDILPGCLVLTVFKQ